MRAVRDLWLDYLARIFCVAGKLERRVFAGLCLLKNMIEK